MKKIVWMLALLAMTPAFAFAQGSATRIRAATAFPASCQAGDATHGADVLKVNGGVFFCFTTGTPGVWLPLGAATTTPTPGTSIALTQPRGYAVCTGTCTVTVPVPAAGYEFCVIADDNVSTVITISNPGSSAQFENTARTAYGTASTGTLVSTAATGNKICLLGRDATHYLTVSFSGSWTAN